MKVLLFILTMAIAQASNAKVMYICTPAEPTSLFSKLVLSTSGGPDYLLSIEHESVAGKMIRSAVANYYDDMTYLGFYSKALNASLQFDYPVNLQRRARVYLGNSSVYVNCKVNLYFAEHFMDGKVRNSTPRSYQEC